ncbi:MAG TPA: hypothetical protein VMH87_08940, partial [Pseudomonadales bacterium]|nr:hypothetical protein [Pseudomonadales bacterium]
MKTHIRALYLITILFCLHVHAATFTWTNTAGGNWSNANNWSPNTVPGQLNTLGSSDDVLITNAGTYTVVLDTGASPSFWDIHSLTLGAASGAQTLVMTNRILYAAPLTITNGGVLSDFGSSFHAVINVQNGGKLFSTNGSYFVNPLTISSGGIFSTRGSVTVESGGSMLMNGTLTVSNGTLTVNAPATNTGTWTVNSGAALSVG